MYIEAVRGLVLQTLFTYLIIYYDSNIFLGFSKCDICVRIKMERRSSLEKNAQKMLKDQLDQHLRKKLFSYPPPPQQLLKPSSIPTEYQET